MLEEVAALPDPVRREITGRARASQRHSGGHDAGSVGRCGNYLPNRGPMLPRTPPRSCVKSGNARDSCAGGSEAIHSNRSPWCGFCTKPRMTPAFRGMRWDLSTPRIGEAVRALLTSDKYVDVVIPRGGKAVN